MHMTTCQKFTFMKIIYAKKFPWFIQQKIQKKDKEMKRKKEKVKISLRTMICFVYDGIYIPTLFSPSSFKKWYLHKNFTDAISFLL